MAESLRDVLTFTDPYKAAAPYVSNAFAGAKVLGHMAGRTTMIDNRTLMDLGRNFILTAVTSSGSATNAIQAPTATLPPVLKLTTGTTADDNLQLQLASAQTASATAA